jgi:hypothetical protein
LLDGYIVYENEKNFAQVCYDYIYQDKDYYFFKDKEIKTDEDFDSLDINSPQYY